MDFNFQAMIQAIISSVRYLGTTLEISFVALVIGIVLGLAIALLRYYNVVVLSPVFQVLTTVFKGVPVVLIFLALYLFFSTGFDPMAKSMGWSIRFKQINPMWIAIICLGLMAVVNGTEVFRGAFSSVRKGQLDAAQSIGMTRMQTIRRVLLPQAVPVAVPVFGNLLINLIKASALCSMVGVIDIFSAATISGQQSYTFLEAYVGVALIYWAVVALIEQASRLLERGLTVHMRRAVA